MPKSQRGLAVISPEKRREIAGQGGKAAHAMGRAHRWTKEEASRAGRKGGLRTKRKLDRERQRREMRITFLQSLRNSA